VTSNGFGTGRIAVGPKFYTERWHVNNIAVQTAGFVLNWTIEARVYAGPAVPENLIGGTYDGITDSISVDIEIGAGEIITAEWSNPSGLAGFPTLTLSLYGEQLMGDE
jgi:hypothetical protein